MATTGSKYRIETPTERVTAVRAYLSAKGAHNYRSVFAAHGVSFNDDEAKRLNDLWNRRVLAKEEDLPMIKRMEQVVEVIRNSQAA